MKEIPLAGPVYAYHGIKPALVSEDHPVTEFMEGYSEGIGIGSPVHNAIVVPTIAGVEVRIGFADPVKANEMHPS